MTPFHWDKALPKSFAPSVDFVKESSLLRRIIPQQLLLHSPCQCHGGIFSGLPYEELVGFLEVVPKYADSKTAALDGEGQGSLACCSPWSHKELDMTE